VNNFAYKKNIETNIDVTKLSSKLDVTRKFRYNTLLKSFFCLKDSYIFALFLLNRMFFLS